MPTSFKVFLTVAVIIVLVIGAATFIQINSLGHGYNELTGFFLFLAFSFMPVGIYAGIKEKNDDEGIHILNKVGLIGNLVLYLAIFVFIVIIFIIKFF